MKRKDLDSVNDDFSEISLLPPSLKTRRLDADLPPIMEEKEAMPLAVEPSLTEESPSVPSLNEERALMIFNPASTPPLLHSPPNFSVAVDSNVISGFKNFWARQLSHVNPPRDEETEGNENSLAIVPWAPSQDSQAPVVHGSQAEAADLIEADEMEVEESSPWASLNEAGGARGGNGNGNGNGLPQWLQQHCMTPQLPLSTSSPVVWYQ